MTGAAPAGRPFYRMAASGREDNEADEERWRALMVRAQAGDDTAYRELLAELAKVSSHFLKGRLGNQHFIEDCVQDTLLAIHQARHTYDPQRPFRAWFYAILRYKVVDYLRRQRSAQQPGESQLSAQAEEPNATQQTLDEAIAPGRLIQALSPPHREAIALTKIIGLSNAEAAARLDISEGALKVRVHRAIGRMRRMLEAEHS